MLTRADLLDLIDALREEARANGDPDGLLEAEVFALVALAWRDAAEGVDVGEWLAEEGDGAEAVTEAEVEGIRAGLGAALGTALAATVAGGLWRLLRAAFGDAKQHAIGGDGASGDGRGGLPPIPSIDDPQANADRASAVQLSIRFRLADERAVGWLQEHNLYWVRTYFDRQLGERVAELGERVIREGLSRDAAGELFAAELGPVYGEGLRYWRLFAANAVTRSRELGRTSAYEAAGLTEVYWSSVNDRRRSEQCAYLHGRPLGVSALVAQRERLLAITDPEEVKTVAPWRTAEEVRALVEANGGRIPAAVGAPPIHGSCRSRTVATVPPGTPDDVAALAAAQRPPA